MTEKKYTNLREFMSGFSSGAKESTREMYLGLGERLVSDKESVERIKKFPSERYESGAVAGYLVAKLANLPVCMTGVVPVATNIYSARKAVNQKRKAEKTLVDKGL